MSLDDKPEKSHNNSGQRRIADAFKRAHRTHIAALMPFFTLGYPDRNTSLAIIDSIHHDSDLLELGIPFSDPIADGPTIQRSSQQALQDGISPASCLEMLGELRGQGISTPALLMGYYNPILAYGEERFIRDAADSGADGLIIPDLPPEESRELEFIANARGLTLIHFLAPTSSPHRVAQVVSRADGFIYMVSLTGITGARTGVSQSLAESVLEVKSQTDVPVAVGFGINSPEQTAAIGAFADGIIVGSALINAVDAASDKLSAANSFVRSLRLALSR